MNCIFCEIIAGHLPGSFVFRGEQVVAFLSLEQPNPYKVLVAPRAHVETLWDLDENLAAAIFQTTVRIARAIRTVSGCEGLNIIQSNGTAAQQEIFHFHIHLLPRFADDTPQGRVLLQWEHAESSRQRLDQLAQELRLGLHVQEGR